MPSLSWLVEFKVSVTIIAFFFFQAEDGIRYLVTGVQTCALPISPTVRASCQALAATCCAHCQPVSACGRRGAWRLYCCFVGYVLYAHRSLIKILGDQDVCGCKEWWKAVQGERGPGTGRRPPLR